MPKRYSDYSRSGKYRYEKSLRKSQSAVQNDSDSEDEASPSSSKPRKNETQCVTQDDVIDTENSDDEDLCGEPVSDSENSDVHVVYGDKSSSPPGSHFHAGDICEGPDCIELSVGEGDNSEVPLELGLLKKNEPLYTGAPLTIDDSMLRIMNMIIKHNLTATCTADLLQVVKLHCPSENLHDSFSLYHFQKYFSLPSRELIKEYYCSQCLISLQSETGVCTVCKGIGKVLYFLRVPIIPQLQSLLMKKEFYNSLQERFNRITNDQNISDVFDGSLYQEQVNKGFLSNPNNISFTFFYDGVPVFKSSGVSMWPFCLRVLELPVRERNRPENTMLAGLWFGSKKTDSNLFISSFYVELQSLHVGHHFTIHNMDEPLMIRAVLLTGSCDLPAKSMLLNTVQFNGKYGCPSCEIEGETLTLSHRSHTHVYPYNSEIKMRSSQGNVEYAKMAFETGQNVKGVKGPTVLSKIMPDFINGMSIDPMHCIYEGVVKKLLFLWFDSSFVDCPFTLRPMITVIDQRLIFIRPPKLLHRMPRSVSELCHWKASELKNCFFYYLLPVFSGIMRPDYFANVELLVAAVSLLNSNDVSLGMIEASNKRLHLFVQNFQQLYGLRHCSINIHQLLHLPEKVSCLGPLWVQSCFSFEDLNGKLLNKIHGTTNLDTQVVNSHVSLQSYYIRVNEQPEGEVKDFLLGHKRQVKVTEMVGHHIHAVGVYKILDNFTGVLGKAALSLNLTNCKMWTYSRLLKKNILFVAESYGKIIATESCFIAYSREITGTHFGKILSFLKVSPDCICKSNCTCDGKHFAILQKMLFQCKWTVNGPPVVDIPFVFKCRTSQDVILVKLQHIQSVCFHVNVDGLNTILATPMNDCELE